MATKYVKSIKFTSSGEVYQIRDAEAKERLDNLVIPSIEGLASEAYVNQAVAPKADSALVYTKAEVDMALNSKQDTLTAGTGITIQNNVISATGSGPTGPVSFSDLQGAPEDNVALKASLDGKQATLVSSENIKTINNQSLLGSGNITIGGSGTSDYDQLSNRPQVNDVTLTGNKSASDLGLATKAQGDKADTAVQPSDLGSMAYEKSSDYTKTESLGSMAFEKKDDYSKTSELGSMAFEKSSDYSKTTELGSMAFESKDDYATTSSLSSKQDTLVSGENIKTINNVTLLGSGNIEIGGSVVTPAGEASVFDDSQPKNLFGETTTEQEVEIETAILDRQSTCAFDAAAATYGPFILGNQTAERGKQLASVSFLLKSKNPDSDYFSFYISNLGMDEVTAASQLSSFVADWRTTGYTELFRVYVTSADLNSLQNYKLDGSDDRVVYINTSFLDNEGYLVIPAQHFIGIGDPLNLTNFGYARGSAHPDDPNNGDFFYLNAAGTGFSKSNANFGYTFYEKSTETQYITTQNFDEYLITKTETEVTELLPATEATINSSSRAYQGGMYFVSNCSGWNGKLLKAFSYCPRQGNTGKFVVGYSSTGDNNLSDATAGSVTLSGIRTLFTINPGDDGYTSSGETPVITFMLDGSDPRVTIVATDLYDSERGGFVWNQTMVLGGDDRANAESSAADKEAGTYAMAWFNASASTDYYCSHWNSNNITGDAENESCTLYSHSSTSILLNFYVEETRTVIDEDVHSDVIQGMLEDIEDLKEGGSTESPLKGKYLSIIGDSISTFSGWSNIAPGSTSAAIYYPKPWLNDVNQTYWKKLVDRTGMNLLVNNSWSGSECAGSASSASCVVSQVNDRCHQLHKDGINPDIILINIGTNDFDHDFELGTWNGRGELFPANPQTTSPSTFREAYAVMLYRLRQNYPLAKVYCCTIPCGNNEGGEGLNEINGKGYTLSEWNDAIREVATAFGARIIELATSGLDYYTLDTLYGDGRLHPSEAGMERYYEIIRPALENEDSSNVSVPSLAKLMSKSKVQAHDAQADNIVAAYNDLVTKLTTRGVLDSTRDTSALATGGLVLSNQGAGNAGKVLGIDSTGEVVPVTSGGGGTIITPAGIASVFDDSQTTNLFEVTPGQDVEYFQTDVITPEMSSTHRAPATGIYYPAGTCYNDICGKYISAVKFLVWRVVANSPWEVYIRNWQTDDLHNITPSSTAPATSDILLFKVQPVAADEGNYVTFALDGSDPRITDINQDYVVDGMIHIPAQHYMGLHATSDSGVSCYGYTQSGSTVATPQTFVYVSSGGSSVSVNQGTLFYDVSYQTAPHASETEYAFDKYLISDKPVYDSELTIKVIGDTGTLSSAKGGVYFLNPATHSAMNGKVLNAVELFGRENRVIEFVKAAVTDNTINLNTGSPVIPDIIQIKTGASHAVPEQYVLFRVTPSTTDTTTPTLFKLDGSDSRVEIVNTSLYDSVQGGFPIDQTMFIGISDLQNPSTDTGNNTCSFFYQTAQSGGSGGFYSANDSGTVTAPTTSTSTLGVNPYYAVATGETTKEINSGALQTQLWSRLYGKKVCVFGGSEAVESKALDYWKEKLDVDITDYASAGAGLIQNVGTTSIQDQVAQMITDNVKHDLYVIWASSADQRLVGDVWTAGSSQVIEGNTYAGQDFDIEVIGALNDTARTSQSGGLNWILNQIYTFDPTAKIVVFNTLRHFATGPAGRTDNGYNDIYEDGSSVRHFADAQIRTCEYWGIPYLDQFRKWGVNTINKTLFVESDNLTPTEDGFERIASLQVELIANM